MYLASVICRDGSLKWLWFQFNVLGEIAKLPQFLFFFFFLGGGGVVHSCYIHSATSLFASLKSESDFNTDVFILLNF